MSIPAVQPWDEHNRRWVSHVRPSGWHNPRPQGRYNLLDEIKSRPPYLVRQRIEAASSNGDGNASGQRGRRSAVTLPMRHPH